MEFKGAVGGQIWTGRIPDFLRNRARVISGPALVDFLNQDTNRLATLVLLCKTM